jgi:hypothetical protein
VGCNAITGEWTSGICACHVFRLLLGVLHKVQASVGCQHVCHGLKGDSNTSVQHQCHTTTTAQPSSNLPGRACIAAYGG